MRTRSVVLSARPDGVPKPSDFEVKEIDLQDPGPSQMIVKSLYVSVDPYLRSTLGQGTSYANGLELGHPVVSGVVAKVIKSNNSSFREGEFVQGLLPWQECILTDGSNLEKVDPNLGPLSTALGILGMPGMTAYFGIEDIAKPKDGETVLVSSASGAVGSVVGQICKKIHKCRVVGIVGSDEKVDYVTSRLGFDAAINYKKGDLLEQLRAACPQGIDVYWENVGGDMTDKVFELLNRNSRVVVCGAIAEYNRGQVSTGPRHLLKMIDKRIMMKGFIVFDYHDKWPEGRREMARWIENGSLVYDETFEHGLDKAPKALIDLFTGEHLGKLLIKIADE